MVAASTATNTVVRNIGPLSQGVRPFTINGKHTLAFTTAQGFLGFQVGDTTSGATLYAVTVPAARPRDAYRFRNMDNSRVRRFAPATCGK